MRRRNGQKVKLVGAPAHLLISWIWETGRSLWFLSNNQKHQRYQHSSHTKPKTQQLLGGKLILSQLKPGLWVTAELCLQARQPSECVLHALTGYQVMCVGSYIQERHSLLLSENLSGSNCNTALPTSLHYTEILQLWQVQHAGLFCYVLVT